MASALDFIDIELSLVVATQRLAKAEFAHPTEARSAA
jgi:hypothetical protein